MNIPRRKFIKTGIAVAAFAGVPLKAQFANARNKGSDQLSASPVSSPVTLKSSEPLNFYKQSTFTPYVNTKFRVRLNSSKVREITLAKVKGYSSSPEREAVNLFGGNRERFSLFFVGPRGKSFPQKTYEVEHAALGKFQLFIVPIGMGAGGGDQQFEAVFNCR